MKCSARVIEGVYERPQMNVLRKVLFVRERNGYVFESELNKRRENDE